MLRISYIKKTCPQCGNVYKICKSETQTSVGSPIINCKKCGNQFVDSSFMEPAYFRLSETCPNNWHPVIRIILGILLFTDFVLILLQALLNVEAIMGVMVCCSLAIWLIFLYYIVKKLSYPQEKRKWIAEYNMSVQRLGSSEYMTFLKEIYGVDPVGTMQLDIMPQETKKQILDRVTSGKERKSRLVTSLFTALGVVGAVVFLVVATTTASPAKTQKLSDALESADFVKDEVVYICDFGRESMVRQNTNEEVSGSGKNYTLLLNEAGDYAIFTMSDEQNKKCKEKNESFKVYGKVTELSDDFWRNISEETKTLFTQKPQYQVELLDNQPMTLNAGIIAVLVVDIVLFIVAVILKIFYIQKYGMIIKDVNANYIEKLS